MSKIGKEIKTIVVEPERVVAPDRPQVDIPAPVTPELVPELVPA